MSNKIHQFRMDFIYKITSFDKNKGIFTARMISNPDRYEWKEINSKKYLYDKLDNTLLPEKVMKDLAEYMIGKPIYLQTEKIKNIKQYLEKRIPIIIARLKGYENPPSFRDKSELFLKPLSEDKLRFVILCVDIGGSTTLSTNLEPKKYARLISTTLYEMSEIIPKFHGYVLKYTGDGIIAYFPEPFFISQNDLAIDCAITIRHLVYSVLNQILEENDYPPIFIRMGLDSGEAYVKTIGSPEAKQHTDIIGAVVNLSTKIQSLGDYGDILLGEVTEKNLHIMRRKICEKVTLEKDWGYKGKDGKPYKVYKVKFKDISTEVKVDKMEA